MPSYWEVQKVPSAGGDVLEDMQTYVSQPSPPGRAPAVIVCQEGFGVTRHIQGVADRYAAKGYFAVAPALFHREGVSEAVPGTNPAYGFDEMDAVMRAMGNLRDDNVILDINTTIRWLQNHPRVQGDRIGITGFCMGGRVTYLAATACPGLAAASVYYGGSILGTWGAGPSALDRSAGIQCPIMGNFGDQDQNPTPADVATIEAELTRLGKTYDFKMYAGAGHGFNCDERDSWHEASARDAWTRTLSWFQKCLAPVAASA